jgi:transcriptional regulator with XRE-family HTH domain
MPKVATRPISRYTQTALELLGQTIRAERIASRISAEQLAVRADISRSLLQRVEKGDPGCAIGVVFELAAILGVPLFTADSNEMTNFKHAADLKLAVLPKTARRLRKEVKDDF